MKTYLIKLLNKRKYHKAGLSGFFYMNYIILLIGVCTTSCQEKSTKSSLEITSYKGKTMGTHYNIRYLSSNLIGQEPIDSLLYEINQSVSTYIDSSLVSTVNQWSSEGKEKKGFKRDKHFESNLQSSLSIYNLTEAYFDPTVMPLVNYWGFGYTPKKPVTQIDSVRVMELQTIVGLDKWNFMYDDSIYINKPKGGQLDFSAIAKGYGVDKIVDLLESKNISNYMVEIGGEVRAKGHNDKGQIWRIGINTPKEEVGFNDIAIIVELDGKSLASSGNYRNFHVSNGIKYGHEINPKTGFPERNRLLGVSVISDNCMEADAIATALMVMGLEQAKSMINTLDNVEACFFYGAEQGEIMQEYSEGFKQYILMDRLND